MEGGVGVGGVFDLFWGGVRWGVGGGGGFGGLGGGLLVSDLGFRKGVCWAYEPDRRGGLEGRVGEVEMAERCEVAAGWRHDDRDIVCKRTNGVVKVLLLNGCE